MVRKAVDTLKPGTTWCPGALAVRLGVTQRELRPVLVRLAGTGRLRITQQGVARDLRTLRGPYRVGPGRRDRTTGVRIKADGTRPGLGREVAVADGARGAGPIRAP
jgi:hypothetical protein